MATFTTPPKTDESMYAKVITATLTEELKPHLPLPSEAKAEEKPVEAKPAAPPTKVKHLLKDITSCKERLAETSVTTDMSEPVLRLCIKHFGAKAASDMWKALAEQYATNMVRIQTSSGKEIPEDVLRRGQLDFVLKYIEYMAEKEIADKKAAVEARETKEMKEADLA